MADAWSVPSSVSGRVIGRRGRSVRLGNIDAFSDPVRLARWWGPAGFTNTFTICEFKPGGQWSFTMHGPDGTNYPNAISGRVDQNIVF